MRLTIPVTIIPHRDGVHCSDNCPRADMYNARCWLSDTWVDRVWDVKPGKWERTPHCLKVVNAAKARKLAEGSEE